MLAMNRMGIIRLSFYFADVNRIIPHPVYILSGLHLQNKMTTE